MRLRAPPRSRDQALLVSLANGKLVALDKDTGKKLWTFDSGAPLLSSTNRQAAFLAEPGELGGREHRTSCILSPEMKRMDVLLTLCCRPAADLDVAPQRVGSIFPGTDGSLYAYVATDGGLPRIEVRCCLHSSSCCRAWLALGQRAMQWAATLAWPTRPTRQPLALCRGCRWACLSWSTRALCPPWTAAC